MYGVHLIDANAGAKVALIIVELVGIKAKIDYDALESKSDDLIFLID